VAHNYLNTRGSVTKKRREFCGTGLLFRLLLPSADDLTPERSFWSASSSATSAGLLRWAV